MPSPGLLFVSSKVIKDSDELYNRFYNEEHLPDVLATGDTKLALRYKNTNPESKMPYLAIYPLDDAGYFQTDKLKKLKDDTRISKVYGDKDRGEYIEFGLRPYEKIQTFEGFEQEQKSGKERGQTIVCVAMEPAEGGDDEFDEWYKKQHLDMLAMCRGYRRSTRYKRLDGEKPRYLALHEYACKASDLPGDQIKQVVSTEWSKKIIKE